MFPILPFLFTLLVLVIVGALIFKYAIPLIPAGLVRNIVILILVAIACLILLSFIGIGPGIKLQ